jgi:hypothetical protein
MSLNATWATAGNVDVDRIQQHIQSPKACPDKLGTCVAILNECISVVEDYDNAIQLQQTYISKCEERVQNMNVELVEARDSLSSPLRNPFITGLAGALIGALLFGLANK